MYHFLLVDDPLLPGCMGEENPEKRIIQNIRVKNKYL